MTAYTQTDRLMSLETPLGTDALLLAGFNGAEGLSKLFRYDLDLSSTGDSVEPTAIVGKNVTITLRLLDESDRYFNGYVSRFVYLGHDDRLSHYGAQVVPWLWFLGRTSNCRIFQNKSVPQILEEVFTDRGFSDFDTSGIGGNHPELEYCVQYRETDLAFVTRLMELEGIFYYFRHEQGKHTLVLADQAGAYQPCPESQVQYTDDQANQITGWEHGYEYRSGKYTQTDYNFETPSASLLTTESTVVPLDGISAYELFDYPGGYARKPDGQATAKVRMEEDEVPYNVVNGAGRCRTFNPGGTFTLERHPSAAEEGKSYVITSIVHKAKLSGAYTTGGGPAGDDYQNQFTCVPDSVVFRPPRTTPKAVVRGAQTAVVVGPPGEEIYPDKYGRIKVQFFWDRKGEKNENSSCWVRVAQPWAGNNWGAVFLPRIGQEVVVDFLEGDPDRPLITGSVYNAEQMPPYALPDNKTQSGIKTRSSTGGSDANFNELRFEDKKGSEDIFFHAEKDFHREVENDDDLKVGHDQTIEVKNNRTETVKEGDETVTVEKGNRTITVNTGNDLHEVKQGDRTVLVDAGNDTHEVKQGNRQVSIDMGNDTLTIKTGDQTTTLSLGKSQTEAMQSIELKVGQSSVKIDQTGVTIQGMLVTINGQVQTQISGMMTQVTGSAMLQAKGGITMIG